MQKNIIDPALQDIADAGNDPADLNWFVYGLETVATGTLQSFVPLLRVPTLRSSIMAVGAAEARSSAIAATLIPTGHGRAADADPGGRGGGRRHEHDGGGGDDHDDTSGAAHPRLPGAGLVRVPDGGVGGHRQQGGRVEPPRAELLPVRRADDDHDGGLTAPPVGSHRFGFGIAATATVGGDGESAGWPRPGIDRVEESRGSTGQGAGESQDRGDLSDRATENRPPMDRFAGHRQG